MSEKLKTDHTKPTLYKRFFFFIYQHIRHIIYFIFMRIKKSKKIE